MEDGEAVGVAEDGDEVGDEVGEVVGVDVVGEVDGEVTGDAVDAAVVLVVVLVMVLIHVVRWNYKKTKLVPVLKILTTIIMLFNFEKKQNIFFYMISQISNYHLA